MMSSLINAGSVRSSRQCAVLAPTAGTALPHPIALNRPVCVVGDRSRVHLVLASPLVSRSHALLVDDADGLYVRDLASSNGVFVNEDRVREILLKNGDQLRIGPFTFECRLPRRPSREADPAEEPMLAEIRGDGVTPVRLNDRRTALIGARRGCDVRVDGIGVSSVHAIVFRRQGRWFIRDLSSEGGTRIYGRLIREAELLGGEQIRIGTATVSFVRPGQLPDNDIPGDAAEDADEAAFQASLLDIADAMEIGPDESAEGLPVVTENWSRQEGFDAPQVTASDLGLDGPMPSSALASASNLQSVDPEQTLMDASHSILTLADLIDMPTGTPDDLELVDEPEPKRPAASSRSAWSSSHSGDRPSARNGDSDPDAPVKAPQTREFDHEMLGNPEESGALPQPWALLGIDSALDNMGLGDDRPRSPQADDDRQSLRQLTFVPLQAGWAKCPGCGTAFPVTSPQPTTL